MLHKEAVYLVAKKYGLLCYSQGYSCAHYIAKCVRGVPLFFPTVKEVFYTFYSGKENLGLRERLVEWR